MNAALTLPRGLRHPSWYVPLLLPILPIFGAYGASDNDQYSYLVGAFAMLVVGLLYSVGLGAWIDHSPSLVRKEVEQLRPAWMLGLFGAQAGLMFTEKNQLDQVLVIPPLMFALLAALSFGIEFQQRTMPSLLCAPVDRLHLWRVKMTVLAGALLTQVFVLVLSAMAAHGTAMHSNIAILAGCSLAFAYAAWATVPLWSLLTRNLLAGLVLSLAVPPVLFSLGGSLVEWIASPFGIMSDISGVTLWTVTGIYLLAAPWVTRRRWLALEAPDLPEREMSGLFLGRRQTHVARLTAPRSWLSSLIGKEIRLQTVTLVTLAVGLLLTLSRLYVPGRWISQELVALLIGLFAVVSVLLAGATAIAEERRLGTLDSHVLLPISRSKQWFLKLLVALLISGAAVALLVPLAPAENQSGNFYLPLLSILVLFVFSFLASSAAPNSLRALILGIAFTGAIVATCYLIVFIGLTDRFFNDGARIQQAIDEPGPWLAQARALSESEAAALEDQLVPRFFRPLMTGSALAACLPLLLALAFSRYNFAHPAAATRRLSLQFPLCVLATLIVGAGVVGCTLWLRHSSATQHILGMARKQVDLEARLSPTEFKLYQALRRNRDQGLSDQPGIITFLRRSTPGAGPRLPAPRTQDPSPRWETVNLPVPLTAATRAVLIRDGDIPEDLREALRQEAIAKGDPDVPATPGLPPGPWPTNTSPAGAGFQMSPELMRRYGLMPRGGPTRPTATPSTNPPAPGEAQTPTAANPPPTFQMSPEMMKRYGLLPTAQTPRPTNNPTTPPTP